MSLPGHSRFSLGMIFTVTVVKPMGRKQAYAVGGADWPPQTPKGPCSGGGAHSLVTRIRKGAECSDRGSSVFTGTCTGKGGRNGPDHEGCQLQHFSYVAHHIKCFFASKREMRSKVTKNGHHLLFFLPPAMYVQKEY